MEICERHDCQLPKAATSMDVYDIGVQRCPQDFRDVAAQPGGK